MNSNSNLLPSGEKNFYTREFRDVLEQHIERLLNNHSSIVPVREDVAIRFNKDFYGLLKALKVEPQFHWINLRLNGFYSPDDYNSSQKNVLIVNPKEIESIHSNYLVIYN